MEKVFNADNAINEIAKRQSMTKKGLYHQFRMAYAYYNPEEDSKDIRAIYVEDDKKFEKILTSLKLKKDYAKSKNIVIYTIKSAENVLNDAVRFTQEEYANWYEKLLEQRIKVDKKPLLDKDAPTKAWQKYEIVAQDMFDALYSKWIEKRNDIVGPEPVEFLTREQAQQALNSMMRTTSMPVMYDDRANENADNVIVYHIQCAEYLTGQTLNQKEFDVAYERLNNIAGSIRSARGVVARVVRHSKQEEYKSYVDFVFNALYDKKEKEQGKDKPKEQDGGREA